MSVWNAFLEEQNCTYHGPFGPNASFANVTLLYERDCVEEIVHLLIDSGVFLPLGYWEATIFSIAYALIAILGLFGNGLVIFAVLRKEEMRKNPRNVLITNLAISNFVLALIVYPFLWMPAKEQKFSHGAFLCKFCNAFPGSNLYCSTLTISIMAIDRYCAPNVIRPLLSIDKRISNAKENPVFL